MAKVAYFKNPESGDLQKVKIALLPILLPYSALFKGFISFKTFLFLGYIWPWNSWKTVISRMVEKGYKFQSISGNKPVEYLEHKLGYQLPK